VKKDAAKPYREAQSVQTPDVGTGVQDHTETDEEKSSVGSVKTDLMGHTAPRCKGRGSLYRHK